MRESKYSPGLPRLLGPSLIGVLLCVTCLVSSTLAWFQASRTTSVASIKTGSFRITATVMEGEKTVDGDGTTYRLTAGKTYTVMLSRAEDSTSRSGYVFFTYGSQTCTTAPFTDNFTFTLVPSDDVILTFGASFGIPKAETPTIASGETIGTAAEDKAPTDTATLPPDTTAPSQDGTQATDSEDPDADAGLTDAATTPEESTDAPTEPTGAPTEIPSESTVAPSEATAPESASKQ